MLDCCRFPNLSLWPATHPNRLQPYSTPTPNGGKVSILLEQTGLHCEVHFIDITRNETRRPPEFLSLNPSGKIPAILDPDGPGGAPLALFESGAILVHLAGKSGRFLPRSCVRERCRKGCSGTHRRAPRGKARGAGQDFAA